MTVLKCGGEYNEGHVAWLRKQFPADAIVECLTDSTLDDEAFFYVTGAHKIKLIHAAWGGIGWWAKLELFRPDIGDDFLFVDLDTVIHDFEKLEAAIMVGITFGMNKPIVLADFYFPTTSIGSGLMWIPEACRSAVWEKWIADPAGHMSRCHGDQDFLTPWLWRANRWQNIAPGVVISYKAHLKPELSAQHFKPGFDNMDDVGVVCFHGNPRPWHVFDDFVPRFGAAS